MVKLVTVLILGALSWLLEAWILMLAFGIFHHELGWQPHPGYWPSFWVAFAVTAVGVVFLGKLDDEIKKVIER